MLVKVVGKVCYVEFWFFGSSGSGSVVGDGHPYLGNATTMEKTLA